MPAREAGPEPSITIAFRSPQNLNYGAANRDMKIKDAFEKLCHAQDMTPSQVMRRLIRDYLTANGVKYAPASAKKAARR